MMDSRIVILGGGESGTGAAILANLKGYGVFLSDSGAITPERKRALKSHEIKFEEGGHTPDAILKAELVVKSPGIPGSLPLLQTIDKKGIPVVSEIEFAYQFINKAKVVAVTGTNGKTTTTLLIHHLLETAGYKAALGGNIGKSLASLVAEGGYHYYVVEASSFQLDNIVNFRPDIGVLLNITPDHLDRYDNNFTKYIGAKFRIIENLTHEEAFIYCADSKPITKELSKRRIEACMFAISASKNGKSNAYLENDRLIFNYEFKDQGSCHQIPVSMISLIGRHNMVNTMAAVLSALHLKTPISKILKGLKTFRNAPHRMEFVACLEGVGYINDSKATNVDSVYHALEGIKENVIWIAGGIDKGNDYSLIEELVDKKVKGIICLGRGNERLRNFFKDKISLFAETQDMEEAASIAHDWASKRDVVLLSPACSSFDLFDNFEDRGNSFKKAVKGLKKIREGNL